MSAPILAARPSLRVDIVDAPVGRHLPALDGVVEVDRVQAADPDQLDQRRLEIAGLVGTSRLQDRLAPVPSPVEPEAGVSEAEDGRLEPRAPPGLPTVRRYLGATDQAAARPRQAPDLVEPGTRQLMATRGKGDHRLRLHDELELSGL